MAEQRALGVLDLEHEGISELFEQVSRPDADRSDVLLDIIRRMAAHITVEQSVFVPLMREHGIGGPDAADELGGDYHEMQRLLVLIERRKFNSPDVPEFVTELKDVFAAHLGRFSNSIRGETIDKLSESELADLRERLENADETVLSHPHPHLLSLGPISRLTTRLAARFDTLRDRTVRNRYLTPSGAAGAKGQSGGGART